MLIFTIIIFGLATIRTITPFTKEETYRSFASFMGSLLVVSTMIICYIWFLKQYVSLNGA
jgi:hypothetical protein